jgi:hypothetical protein
MEKRYYICTLLSDVVLNSSLATEGNMTSLDYIPGSNFLGIVANKLYKKLDREKALSLFHNGEVKFGDATISKENLLSYSVPFSFFMDKLDNKIEKDPVYLHHLIEKENRPKREGTKITAQLKQIRSGYLLSDFHFIKEVKKSFSLKSAQERETRNSKDGAMFGFDAMQKGQQFIFSIDYTNWDDIALVENAMIGTQRLGKSKNAEFGQVEIEKIEIKESPKSFQSSDYVLVYAKSNLYLTDEETGYPTLQPSVEQLGLSGGAIDWEKSQVRSFTYSPWNGQRKTSSTQRHCIAKGSVFFVKNTVQPMQAETTIGGFQAEGLGQVMYNPFFLESEGLEIKNKLTKLSENKEDKYKQTKEPTSTLALFLDRKKSEKERELAISEKVIECVNKECSNLKDIKASQWGGIRKFASKTKEVDDLHKLLFGHRIEEKETEETKKLGYLTHGVAFDKQWSKGNRIETLRDILKENKTEGTVFIAKFAAEMAKKKQRKDNENARN